MSPALRSILLLIRYRWTSEVFLKKNEVNRLNVVLHRVYSAAINVKRWLWRYGGSPQLAINRCANSQLFHRLLPVLKWRDSLSKYTLYFSLRLAVAQAWPLITLKYRTRLLCYLLVLARIACNINSLLLGISTLEREFCNVYSAFKSWKFVIS